MIISRKRFEEEINKAVAEREEKLWEQRSREDERREIWRRIYKLEERLDPDKKAVCDITCSPVR